MLGRSFNTAKCETTCRLCVGRIKLLRNKKSVQLKQSQKDIAELLRNGKQEYARIRVEGVIRERLLLQAYEILELYLELLTVRAQLVAKTKELPRDMMEAVSSIIYAAQRISDLPELATLRQLLTSKYGKEYATEAASDATSSKWQVNANLIRCLLVEAPQPEDKLATLSEIAQEHGVEWDLSAAAREMGVGAPGASAAAGGSLPLSPTGSVAAAAILPPPPPPSHGVPSMAPAPAHGQFASAQQAAQAAAAAAAHAHAAAEFAAQVAAAQAGGAAVPPPGWLSQPPQQHAPMPPAAPLPPHPNGDFPPPPHHHAGGAAIARGGPGSDANDGGPPVPRAPTPTLGPDGYVVRTPEELQRQYDAALGPPTKGAPAAPPLEPQQRMPTPPPPPQQVEDEYEELTRRLEALKKS